VIGVCVYVVYLFRPPSRANLQEKYVYPLYVCAALAGAGRLTPHTQIHAKWPGSSPPLENYQRGHGSFLRENAEKAAGNSRGHNLSLFRLSGFTARHVLATGYAARRPARFLSGFGADAPRWHRTRTGRPWASRRRQWRTRYPAARVPKHANVPRRILPRRQEAMA